MPKSATIAGTMLALLVSCGVPAVERGAGEGVASTAESLALNPGETSALSPTDFPLNGTRARNSTVVAVAFRGAELRGVPVDSLRLHEGRLIAEVAGRRLAGRELVGLALRARTANEREVSLKVYAAGRDAKSAVDVLRIAHTDEAGWRPLCAGANEALAVPGLWDYREGVQGGGSKHHSTDAFTLSCRGAAIAQCVELGYKPWARPACRRGEVCPESLDGHHQACVRLHRADYCGDGRSWTTAGVFVNLYDGIGVQEDTERWTAEAEWNADGAVCIKNVRLPSGSSGAPACAQPRAHPEGDCVTDAGFRAGSLLKNELEPGAVRR